MKLGKAKSGKGYSFDLKTLERRFNFEQ